MPYGSSLDFSNESSLEDMDDIGSLDNRDLAPPAPFWFSCAVIPQEQRPLLESPDLAQIAETVLNKVASRHSGQLWGYVILPAAVHLVLEVEEARDYHLWVEEFKDVSEKNLIKRIQQVHASLLDDIIFYNPVWGGVVYRFWQDGYHTQALNTPYAVSNRVADLLQKPVEAGLVNHSRAWPFSSYRGE